MERSRGITNGEGGTYSVKSVDREIDHLEGILAGEGADSVFARTYWRGRVLQAMATPGLLPVQRGRLERLLKQLNGSSTEF